MESMSTFGIITSSCSISQEEFDIIDLDIKSEEFDDYMWENELIRDIDPAEEDEPVECRLCIKLYHEAQQGRRFSTRLMHKALWCPHHIIDGVPSADMKVSMKNEDKKRKRTEPTGCKRNKRRRGHTIEDDQQPSCSYGNVDAQPPTTTVENINVPEAQVPLSINANMDGVDGQQNVILEEHVEMEYKDYLFKSANCTTLTNSLSSLIVTKME